MHPAWGIYFWSEYRISLAKYAVGNWQHRGLFCPGLFQAVRYDPFLVERISNKPLAIGLIGDDLADGFEDAFVLHNIASLEHEEILLGSLRDVSRNQFWCRSCDRR